MSTAEHSVPMLGAPCWVSLMARDLRVSQEFYGAVLGWTFRPSSLGEGFSVAMIDDHPVAGLGAMAPSLRRAVAWVPYFSVKSADDTADRIRERGATVAVGPLRFGEGRGALAADQEGAVFGFWEGEVPHWRVGHGSAPAWLELRTRDTFAAAIFYAQVFGWATDEQDGCDVAYEHERVLVFDGPNAVAALRGGDIEAASDPHARTRWHVHFPVRDLRAATAAAEAAGGFAFPVQPTAGSPGLESVIRDPDGGLFTITTRQSLL
jgi:uncharacterized protein